MRLALWQVRAALVEVIASSTAPQFDAGTHRKGLRVSPAFQRFAEAGVAAYIRSFIPYILIFKVNKVLQYATVPCRQLLIVGVLTRGATEYYNTHNKFSPSLKKKKDIVVNGRQQDP